MEMSAVLRNWDELEKKLGMDKVRKAFYKVESSEKLEELSDRLNAVDVDHDGEILEAFLEIWDIEASLSLLESGNYHLFCAKDEEELGREICDNGYVDVPEELKYCIDYEMIGREYSINANGGFTFIGFVEAR